MAPINAQKLTGRTTRVQSASVAPQQQLIASPVDNALLKDISKSLTNIIRLLSQQNLQSKRDFNQTIKTEEQNRRQGIELGLEKPFAVVKKTAQAVVAPVKSILDQIIQFFLTIFVGRALILLLDWFADEKNRSKVRSIMRFLSDWWPSLVAGYILFGTGFGRVVRKVASVAVVATARLLVIAARLTKAIATGKGLKGAAAAFSGGGKLGGLRGFALRGGLAAAATIGTGLLVNKFMGGGGEQETPQLDVPEVPPVPALGAFGGGFANIKDLFSSATSNVNSNIFAPFTALFGSGGLASVMQGLGGVVSGPKGIDKVPAMLTDGEFVMSRGAVQKFGVNTLESMNAAGGGTNIPRIIHGIPHAAGGGLMGSDPGHYADPVLSDNKRLGLEDRLKRIEDQVKIQNALSKGKGVQTSAGMGYGTTYQGRQSILIQNGIKKLGAGTGYDAITVPKINVGGIEYFGQQRGKDIIYSSNFAKGLSGQVDKYGAKSKGYSGMGGGLLNSDKKNLPKTKIMMGPDGPFVGYLTFKGGEPTYQRATQRKKGVMESLADFFDPKGAKGRQETLNARTMRLTSISDLEDMRGRGMKEENIKKMMNERLGPNGYSRAVNDSKAKQNKAAILNRETTKSKPGESAADARTRGSAIEGTRRGGIFGQAWRTGVRMFGTNKDIERVDAADKASDARVKQRVAASQGKYYSSSDGKYYANFAAANKARLARQKPKGKTITPTPKPAPKVVSTKPKVAGGGMGGARGSGANPSIPKIPSSSGSNRKTKNALGVI